MMRGGGGVSTIPASLTPFYSGRSPLFLLVKGEGLISILRRLEHKAVWKNNNINNNSRNTCSNLQSSLIGKVRPILMSIKNDDQSTLKTWRKIESEMLVLTLNQYLYLVSELDSALNVSDGVLP